MLGGTVAALLLSSGANFVSAAQANGQSGDQAATASSKPASVNLNITPKRLTLDRNHRSASVYIFNQGTIPATFDIKIDDRVMLPNGEIRAVDDLGANPDALAVASRLHSAKGLLVATPRRAILAPGKGQTIRVRMMQLPAVESEATEYRSHLTVTTVPPRDSGITADQAAAEKSGELSFHILTLFGLSIPVIIKPAVVDVRAGIENARLDHDTIPASATTPAQQIPVLDFDLVRLGTNSLFGNIEIHSENDGGENKAALGLVRGIGVYPEIDRRMVRIPLQRVPRPGERLSITFTDDDAKPGSVIARSSFTPS